MELVDLPWTMVTTRRRFCRREAVSRVANPVVPPGLHNANLSTELPGDVLSVVGVHAKVRRDGYRR